MNILTLKHQKYKKNCKLRLFFLQFIKIMFFNIMLLCFFDIKLVEVSNVLFKLFQSKGPT